MPNWCENDLNIYAYAGGEEAEKQLKEVVALFGEDGPFQKIKPLPDAEKENWYEWHIANWGTKWDLDKDGTSIEFDDACSAVISFDTAWSPPQPIVLELSRKYPKLEFCMMSYEQGMAYCCAFKCVNGVALNDEEMTYYRNRGG